MRQALRHRQERQRSGKDDKDEVIPGVKCRKGNYRQGEKKDPPLARNLERKPQPFAPCPLKEPRHDGQRHHGRQQQRKNGQRDGSGRIALDGRQRRGKRGTQCQTQRQRCGQAGAKLTPIQMARP